jgi:hypothetical protein
MAYADWKKRSDIFCRLMARYPCSGVASDIKAACEAAYKAGERQGRKDVEEIADRVQQYRDQEYANVRNWAFAEEDAPDSKWQKGYDAARAMVKALLPSNVEVRGDEQGA